MPRPNWYGVSEPFVLAIDQGTSSTKAIAVAANGAVLARGGATLELISSRPGWVEQDPHAVLASVRGALIDLGRHIGLDAAICLGISNQRESLVLWERHTGRPVSPVISWQDRRTIDLVQELSWAADEVRSISGLPLDPMFSAVKARWILDEYDPDRSRSLAGELVLGTIDSWLLFSQPVKSPSSAAMRHAPPWLISVRAIGVRGFSRSSRFRRKYCRRSVTPWGLLAQSRTSRR